MSTFQRILCPIDFSETSEVALRYALDLAETMGARVSVVHVHELPITFVPDIGPTTTAEWGSQLRKGAQASLDGMIDRCHAGKETIDHELVDGTPHIEINKEAKRIGADVVVMGTHGRGKISRLLIGSVAERVVRTSPIPVLTVCPDHEG